MKSFLIWLTAVIVGATIGFGATFIGEFNFYLCLAAGVIIGSSIGFTINIHREVDTDITDEISGTESDNHSDISQKAS